MQLFIGGAASTGKGMLVRRRLIAQRRQTRMDDLKNALGQPSTMANPNALATHSHGRAKPAPFGAVLMFVALLSGALHGGFTHQVHILSRSTGCGMRPECQVG